ncbi:MAG: sulfatase-like hydrolase/transferase [Planctomycetota bacterium]
MSRTARPNVLMVLADQHHAGLLGCAGHPQVKTPRLDAFAQTAVRFTDTYCQNPICTPSRVSLLAGQYPHNTGYYGLGGPSPTHLPSLFGHFRQHGYRTAGFGKLHLPTSPHSWIADHVDRFGDTYETADGRFGESHYFTELEARGLRDREDSWHNTTGRYGKSTIGRDSRPSDLPYEFTQERWCAREALRFADEAAADGKPFFVQLAFQKPHHPLLPVQRFWDLYKDDLDLPPTIDQDPSHRPPNFQRMWHLMRQDNEWAYHQPGQTWRDGARRAWRGTLACISQLDDVFGILLDGLDQRGLADHTIVVYGSDHGCYHGIHGLPEKAPGIGSDAIARVPLMIRIPGTTTPGHVCHHLVENIDLAPTLANAAGLPEPDWIDGHDLAPLLRGDDSPLRNAAFTENAVSKAVRFGPYRLTHYPDHVFNGQYPGELYNLEQDPGETKNLYHDPAHRDTVTQGTRLILDWLATTTRVITGMPNNFEGGKLLGKRHYPLAADGKRPSANQPGREPAPDLPNYL